LKSITYKQKKHKHNSAVALNEPVQTKKKMECPTRESNQEPSDSEVKDLAITKAGRM
jgi:hypothetical protein